MPATRVLLGRAALGHAGLGISIIDLDARAIALLEEALAALGDREPVLRSELLARLAVELYYAPSRDRSEALSSQAVAVARGAGDRRAVAAALNARHVALWRPDRLAERLAAADEMLAVADEPHVELQARNWRVVDLFEALEMDEWRAEVARHGELAARLRMPTYTWYTPLWAAVDAVHAGRWDEAAALGDRAREEGRRAGDRNADLFADMLRFDEVIMRGTWEDLDLELLLERIANSPAGMAWRATYAWMLAATGQVGRRARAVRDRGRRRLRRPAVRHQLAVRDGRARLGLHRARRPRARTTALRPPAPVCRPSPHRRPRDHQLRRRPTGCSEVSPRFSAATTRRPPASGRRSAATRPPASRSGPTTPATRSVRAHPDARSHPEQCHP